jgi:oligogalacturonide transporter
LYLGILFSVFFVFVALAVFLFTWERPLAEIPAADTGPMKSPFTNLNQLFEDLAATLRIRAFRLHLGMYLGGYISQDVLNAVLSYIIAFVFLGSVATSSTITTWMACAQLFSVFAAIWLSLRIHAAPSYRIALSLFAIAVVGIAVLYVMGVSELYWYLAVVIVAGLGRGALNYIPWSVYNYMPDVDEVVTGRRREGAFAGVMTFVRKLMQSVAIFIVSQILNFAGLIPGVKIQPVEIVNVAVIIMVVGTLGLMAFGFIVSLRFKLNRDTHAVLMGEIARFKANDAAPPTAENRAIIEDLSGWKYEELWGKGRSRPS